MGDRPRRPVRGRGVAEDERRKVIEESQDSREELRIVTQAMSFKTVHIQPISKYELSRV